MIESMILKSENIFDGTGRPAFAGYVIIQSGKILEVGEGTLSDMRMLERYRVLDFGDRVICPGFTDVHTFFTGYALSHIGVTVKEGIQPEILRKHLNNRSFIDKEWKDYMKLLNSRGITSVKEMGFDDFGGFTDYLKEQEEAGQLSLRVSFMSQPDSEKANIAYGKKMQAKFCGEYVRFSGYNRMTDGTIASGMGDLLEPYEGTDVHCGQDIDYADIEKDVLEADENGMRYSLHAQGDGAVHKVLDIYDKCRKENGRCVNRHAITDMEFTSPQDLERMGNLGVIAEIYPQIMSLDSGEVVRENIRKTIGEQRGRYYWNRRKMLDCGVTVSCGTDLPLMIPHIGESIYHSCGCYFPEEGEPYNSQNAMTKEELLKAWTWGGQYDLGREDCLGTLQSGKLADITVLKENVFNKEPRELRELGVCMTICGGRIVYEGV